MINISSLLSGIKYAGHSLRYDSSSQSQKYGVAPSYGPVVVWNITRRCNLNCMHCYAESGTNAIENELTTNQAFSLIDDFASFKVPVILFSGGEPLLREDFFDLIRYAAQKGIRVTVSTNGTLITPDIVRELKKAGVTYAGISLDGIGENNDRFRGKKGAFDAALKGIQYCREQDQKVGLRFTINKHNYQEIPEIFKLIEEEGIPRACFYHLVYSGRGSTMLDEDISPETTREAVDFIIGKTEYFRENNIDKEILTVDNHADGVYTYLTLKEHYPQRAQAALELLQHNGGNRSGIAISQVDWQGDVHPDQFTQNHKIGNVLENNFSEIWKGSDHPILEGLRNRKKLLKGRCSQCSWLDVCNGNFRPRAEAVYGDFWAQDPACYLKDEEIY